MRSVISKRSIAWIIAVIIAFILGFLLACWLMHRHPAALPRCPQPIQHAAANTGNPGKSGDMHGGGAPGTGSPAKLGAEGGDTGSGAQVTGTGEPASLNGGGSGNGHLAGGVVNNASGTIRRISTRWNRCCRRPSPACSAVRRRANSNQAMGLKATSADVDFNGANNAHVNVSIKDATAVSGLAGLAEMANSNESEQGDNYEKNETIGGYKVREKWDASSKHGELSLIVAKRCGVNVTGNGVDMDALKNALSHIDLGKLESMKDANPQAQ